MCTSVVYQNQVNDFFLARTMDFSFPLNGDPVFIPKNYTFYLETTAKTFQTQYGFIGAGKNHGEYLFADGVNEEGLGVASLYFAGHANYIPLDEAPEKSLAPQDVVAWFLGSFKNVAEVKKAVPTMGIVAEPSAVINGVLPLHWIVVDSSGASIVIEPVESGIQVYDNPVGVMSNSPDFKWHLANLSQYTTLSNTSHATAKYGEFTATGNGPGSGAFGLPGDFTSISRFVKTAFMNQYTEKVTTVSESINVISRMLSAVYIPKGVKLKTDGRVDYTQYTSFMDLNHQSYVINYYENNQFFKLDLSKITQKETEPKVFVCPKEVVFDELT